MLRKLVGWFAIVAGLLTAVTGGFKIRAALTPETTADSPYQVGAVGAVFLLVGIGLVYLGFRRLGRRRGGSR